MLVSDLCGLDARLGAAKLQASDRLDERIAAIFSDLRDTLGYNDDDISVVGYDDILQVSGVAWDECDECGRELPDCECEPVEEDYV